MSPSKPFIQRPVATSLLMLAIVLTGIVGFRFLPLSALPQVDYPTIQVQTLYPGGSPEVMSRTVTAPLEKQFGNMSGLARMGSTSAAGVSLVTLQFNLGLSLDVAEQEVQAAINAGNSLLPADLPAPPVYAKVNPADAPVLTLAVSSKSMPLPDVQNLVNTRLAQKISQVSGVGLVTLAGGQRPAMRIQTDTRAMASYGIDLTAVRTAITNANANSAKGSFDGASRSYAINANDQLVSVDDYKNLIVSYKNGAPVRLTDIAQVVDSAENLRLAAWADDTPAIIVNVQRQPGANVIQTVDAIKKQLPELQAGLPTGLDVRILSDRTAGIRASVEHVEFELVLAVVLVTLVIFAFLHSWRATVIASLSVPISLVGTCGAMYLLGYSLNNLSLMSLTIATGFVVDDAIVMIENISRYIEHGEKPMAAAIKGATQIGFTIVSLTVSLIAVLIPLLFMGDVVGRLFREFAVTLAITILISAVVSLTLVPMMSGRMLKAEEAPRGYALKFKQMFDWIIARYDRGLVWVLDNQTTTLLVALGTFALTVLLYIVIPKGLFPTQDTGQLQVRVQSAETVSFSRMSELQRQAARAMLEDPAVDNIASIVGVDGANNTMLNAGTMLVDIKQGASGTQEEIMNRLRQRAQGVAGITLYVQPTQDLTIDSDTGPTQYRVSMEGADDASVALWTNKLVERLRSDSKVRNVVTDVGATGLAVEVDLDRDTASRLGISAATVDDALYSAYGQRIVSTIFTETNQYRVILEARPDQATTPTSIGDLRVLTTSGQATPLSAFASIRTVQSPLQVTHVAQYPATTVGFDTADGVSLGTAVDSIRQAAKDIALPSSVTMVPLGAAGAYEKSLSNQLWLILAAVICVYIVLGVLYESYVHPLTILSTLPSAGVGALLALLIGGQDLGVIGIIGIILLIGIVKKNAIMMIDFAIDAERTEGKTPREAIHQAALLRLRPILMTTFAALFAALPLMFGWGEGKELRHPLGLSIFGGLLVSQLLTLFTTPVIYLWFDRLGEKVRARFGMDDGTGDNAPAPQLALEAPPVPRRIEFDPDAPHSQPQPGGGR
ncbi:efflux RND transporter permease subunit [Scleromatobacter humisilvae]|uniref:Efflux RND transporter permease subunit n=1 Tax=Scleromatobacter humisilvae TaxID=2897159 RepID=A0A9X1YKE2_9BURK|nr:efflux RND transporter permease subunit [Scleromatobacter humisilvae]MCK9686443.1 efflux RND transporter permease subunit [Scleromatobacter humisilvae]